MKPIIAPMIADVLATRTAAHDNGLVVTAITTAAQTTSLRPVIRAYSSPDTRPAAQQEMANTVHQTTSDSCTRIAPSGASSMADGGGETKRNGLVMLLALARAWYAGLGSEPCGQPAWTD